VASAGFFKDPDHPEKGNHHVARPQSDPTAADIFWPFLEESHYKVVGVSTM
jgi:hypothetical protein